MARMINADKLIKELEEKVEFCKRMAKETTGDVRIGFIAEMTAYEILIVTVKAGAVDISTLYEDCENGAEDDVVLGWNRAIDKVAEVMKAGGKDE